MRNTNWLGQKLRSNAETLLKILAEVIFSTVRMADRIIVLEHGKIVEQGSHRQLVDLGGKYAELFELQAAGYR